MEKFYYIIGIDPGTTNLGVAIYKIDSKTHAVMNIDTVNIRPKTTLKIDARLEDIGDKLETIFMEYRPKIIYVETPFISLFRPTAVIPLARVFQQIKSSLRFSERMRIFSTIFIDVSPIEAKIAIGGALRTSKEEMALLSDTHLILRKYRTVNQTEHEIDAMAVAYSGFEDAIHILKTGEGYVPPVKKQKKKKKKKVK